MLTDAGARVLEYNVRFGDPEAQAILVRLRSDLSAVFDAVARGRLASVRAEWADESSACVVLAARGYPEKPETGDVIVGLDEAARDPRVEIFHAGTKRDADGTWRTAGGRVLGVTATGATLDDALARSYETAKGISWEGMQLRRDIGKL
jgi:phosphoribosylamine--glycine ligase